MLKTLKKSFYPANLHLNMRNSPQVRIKESSSFFTSSREEETSLGQKAEERTNIFKQEREEEG